MKTLILMLCTLSGVSAFAADPTCDDKMIRTESGKTATLMPSCLLNLPGIANSYQSRSYVISPNGQFMVFESFGTRGRNSTDTGSRSYFLFPIRQKPGLKKNPVNGAVIARTAAGNAIQLGPDGRIAAISGAKIQEDPVISGKNQGGLEISYYDGIVLDSGWATGGQSISNRGRSSSFRDRHGNSCSVPNSKIFSYRSKYDVQLAFGSNEALAAFLKKACPRLDLSPLFARGVQGSGGSESSSAPAVSSGR